MESRPGLRSKRGRRLTTLLGRKSAWAVCCRKFGGPGGACSGLGNAALGSLERIDQQHGDGHGADAARNRGDGAGHFYG